MNFTTRTFTPFLRMLIEDAHQSDNLESLWYHPWSELLNLCAKASSTPDIVFTVAPQREFYKSSRPRVVHVTRETRVGTRSVALPGDHQSLNENDSMSDDDPIFEAADLSMESHVTRRSLLSREVNTHRTPDFSIYQLNPAEAVLFPVGIVEIKPITRDPSLQDMLTEKDSDVNALLV